MYKLCKTERSAKRQREIEQILLDLMQEKRFEEISVTEICERANMPRKSFYRYFEGKDGAMQSLLYHTLLEFDSIRLMDSGRKLSQEFEEFFNFWKGKKSFLDAFNKSGFIGLLIESTGGYAMRSFGDVERYISTSGRDDKLITYQFVVCGIMTMMINWYRTDFAEPVQSLAKTATKIVTKPLFENLTRTE